MLPETRGKPLPQTLDEIYSDNDDDDDDCDDEDRQKDAEDISDSDVPSVCTWNGESNDHNSNKNGDQNSVDLGDVDRSLVRDGLVGTPNAMSLTYAEEHRGGSFSHLDASERSEVEDIISRRPRIDVTAL